MKKYKVRYCVFGNFCSSKTIELENAPTTSMVKSIIWNDVKDKDWDWEITIHDLEIEKITEM